MDLALPKLVILPPLNNNAKLENAGNIRNDALAADIKQMNQNRDDANILKHLESFEAVGPPLPQIFQTKPQVGLEPLKINTVQKPPRPILTSISPNRNTRVVIPKVKVIKNPETIIISRKRVTSQDNTKERSESSERNKMQKPLHTGHSVEIKAGGAIKNVENEQANLKFEDELAEIDERDEENQGTDKKKKKKKGITLLKDMVPLNLEDQRKKFFELNFEYDPQFDYKLEDRNQKFLEPHKSYLKIAEAILEKCLKEYGDDETYLRVTGGRLSTEEEITEFYAKYVKELGLEEHLKLLFSDKIKVSSASCLYRGKGKGTIIIALPIIHREERISSLFNHEIGTHFIRKINERQQPWAQNRKQYGLTSCLIIEEGLAMLNQTLDEAYNPNKKPYLFSAALHYYACYKSSFLSFQDLFKDLEKYIKDPIRRWKECIRVKRGISDTSKPGGMYKDQVYLRGSIKILQNRNKIDFLLLHMGKLNLEDLQRMIKSGLVKTDKMKVPVFLKDIEKYKAALDRIASFNFVDTII